MPGHRFARRQSARPQGKALALALALLAAIGIGLAGCAKPPASAYDSSASSGDNATPGGQQYALGKISSGESCTATRQSHGALVYCGSWQQPSAEVRQGPASDAAGLAHLAASGPWRAGLETRYACGAPRSTKVLGQYPGELLLCTQRLGGWPHVALATLIKGRVWYANGVRPAFAAMERAIGLASGVASAESVSRMSVTVSDRLLADRLAAAAFTSGDIGRYDSLMRVGDQANQAEDYPAAVTAYRAALALQQKALGPDDPATAAPMMDLALNLSDEGDFHQADALFARAEKLAPRATDATAEARLTHYRGLNALNRGKDRDALALLRRAEGEYAALLPKSVLNSRPLDQGGDALAGFGLSAGQARDLLGAQTTLLSPVAQQSLLGVIETLRYQAVALDALGHTHEAASLAGDASVIASNNGIAPQVLDARLSRTAAAIDAGLGQNSSAATRLASAVEDFAAALPGSPPVADTTLLRGAVLAKAGHVDAAIKACRTGVTLLQQLRFGTSAALISPCLGALAQRAKQQPSQAKALHAEMFAMAELAQGSTTSREIAEAAARLATDAKDPKVATAVRAHQDAVIALSRLYRQRDAIAHGGKATKSQMTAIDTKIASATRTLQNADQAVQAAAPNFGQLVQQSVPASKVLALLRPHEAFLDVMPAPHGTWLFFLEDGQVTVARTGTDSVRIAHLVRKVRKSLIPTLSGPPPFAMKDAEAISHATLAPLAKQLDRTTAMVVSTTGPLLSLPFALLPTGPASAGDLVHAPWLIRKMTLAYVPAAANFVALRQIAGTSRATKPWFGFGGFQNVSLAQAKATFSGPACAETAKLFAGLPSLPYAKLELAAGAAIYHAGSNDELLGRNFTVPAIEHANLAAFRILHFATHAILPSELPCLREPAIVTSAPSGAHSARDAMLTSSDITNLNLNADLIVLSACNTGGGNGRSGAEALSGLARSFFFAGARAMMVTQWAVNSKVSAYLVATTLQDIEADHGGAAASLRAAQLSLLDTAAGGGTQAQLADPFYWAPFVVIGDGGRSEGAAASGRMATAASNRQGS